MIPEEMYQTLDETSLEHWVMELPEDEAKCDGADGRPARWWHQFLCGHGVQACVECHVKDVATLIRRAGENLICRKCHVGHPAASVTWRPL